ncbi:ral guanine nucleotide dissociation stimulator-like 3 isoform X2 [Malaclemys terrapin pileata]|uniref:ral guanine nucleotide dissociation stimulator-like 3 isoform X2 n=1 Tax=Malaclemys terrapin pileata TaxID=2991368 RepID=UPI0023A7BF98|nr:ral guanine nucleotide dissociation stimulator-like 3 isoform X2 [Malaclemys terrapin pileata]
MPFPSSLSPRLPHSWPPPGAEPAPQPPPVSPRGRRGLRPGTPCPRCSLRCSPAPLGWGRGPLCPSCAAPPRPGPSPRGCSRETFPAPPSQGRTPRSSPGPGPGAPHELGSEPISVCWVPVAWSILPLQEPLQQWGEEVEDGAIYSVTLQRVRAEPAANGGPCPLAGVEPPCPFVLYRTCKLRRLRAGTLPQLVRALVSASAESDPGYRPSFLATYRAFATPGRVLELLLPLGPDRAVLQVLELWLRHHPQDFREPPQHPSLRQLHSYLRQAAPGSEGCARAEGLLQSFQEEPGDEQAEPESCESPGAGPLALEGEGGPEGCGEPPDLLSFSAEEVAEQLTLMDIELFTQVQPFHCLGCVWSQRDRKVGEGAAPSVRATVAQFNAVTGCVIASVLGDVQLRAQQRARLLEKWVAIAQHCYVLRNFSSLRAVISALQSSPVHRLKRTWAAVSRDTMGVFWKLSQIFSDDKNHLSCREILLQGDAAQGVPEGAPSPRVARKATPKLNPPEKPVAPPPGTVPYLGTFLTDLVMLDTALPDFLEGGLINFEKRRKEAEILLQIQQLQASCGGHALHPNPAVLAAFQRHARLSEEQSYRVSRLIEPPADSCPNSPRVKRSLSKRFSSLLLGAEALPPRLPSAKGSISPSGTGSSCEADEGPSSPCSPEMGGSLGKSLLELPFSTCPPEEPPSPLARRPCSPLYNQQGADSCIVRVSMDNAHGNLYKSILLTSQDKTPAVVLRALQKHSLEGTPPGDFQLLQLLGGGRGGETEARRDAAMGACAGTQHLRSRSNGSFELCPASG